MTVTTPSRKRHSHSTTSTSGGAWSPRIEKIPSKMTMTRPGRRACAMAVQIRNVACLKIVLRGGHVRDPHRADDAVVIERVTHPERPAPTA
jgi:hypothetical protein